MTSKLASPGKLKEMASSVDMDFAQLDLDRRSRIGIAEAVYAPGKTPEQCVAIVSRMLDEVTTPGTQTRGPILLSRPDETQLAAVIEACPPGTHRERLVFWNQLNPNGAVSSVGGVAAPADAAAVSSTNGAAPNQAPQPKQAPILIATAGTADLPTAKECAGVLEAYGISSTTLSDIGVAGIHRTLAAADNLAQAKAVVVIAGMEGALASVIGGLTPAPIIAVPSSAGYGTSFEGMTALLSMLSSCAPGITVVGIDNGFGAACAILRMLRP